MNSDATARKHEDRMPDDAGAQADVPFGFRFSGLVRFSAFGFRTSFGMALSLLCAGAGWSQTTTLAPASPPPEPAGVTLEGEARPWSFSVSAFTYFPPVDDVYVQPTFTVDRGWLHLEARYNYEDLDTGSVWAGYNFGGGDTLAWELTPMLGGVFGSTSGIAPGYKGSLSWWWLELYSEGEYVFASGDSSESFFYNWSELSLAPVDWLRFGLVTQRTRAYETEREIERGLLLGVSWKAASLTGYVFNPDDSDPTFVVALGLDF